MGRGTRWQGTYFVLLKANTLLCASSDRYLKSVLRRADEVPASRTLPDDLPEWKQVDFDAPMWMLRHIPEAAGKTRASASRSRSGGTDSASRTFPGRALISRSRKSANNGCLPAYSRPGHLVTSSRSCAGPRAWSSCPADPDLTMRRSVSLGSFYWLQAFERFDRGE